MQNIRIASPCSADWNHMVGTDRVRYCPECKLNVYNFSAMSPAEIKALASAKTGRLCARFYQRADGTMLTQNCPVGFRGALLRAIRLASVSLSAIIALSHTKSAQSQILPGKTLVQIEPVNAEVTLEVVDPVDAVITNAKISVVNETTQELQEITTNELGRATLSLRSNYSYSINITSLGFKATTLTHMQAPLAKFVTVRLEISSVVMGGAIVVPTDDIDEPVISTDSFQMPTSVVLPRVQPPTGHHSAISRFFSKLRHIF